MRRRRARLNAIRLLLAVMCLMVLAVPAATAQDATPPAVVPWEITELRELEVEGQLVTLSPDGRAIAGVGPTGGEICIWPVETLEPTCAGRAAAHGRERGLIRSSTDLSM